MCVRLFFTWNTLSQDLSQNLESGCPKLAIVKSLGVQYFKGNHIL